MAQFPTNGFTVSILGLMTQTERYEFYIVIRPHSIRGDRSCAWYIGEVRALRHNRWTLNLDDNGQVYDTVFTDAI